MSEIYALHHGDEAVNQKKINLAEFEDSSSLSSQVIENVNELFPTLENPMLIMYVFPHIATESRVPVPGYWTAIPMYERTEFALPGEKASTRSDSD